MAGDLAYPARPLAGERALLAGILVIAAVLRFATLRSQSYWFDEAQAVHEMQVSFGSMLHLWSANEPNPPLYFIVAWPWARIFGTGEAGLRSLSAVLGTVTVGLVYLCGRELVSRRAGLVAAALSAINPFLIWYSQEAREYMLLTALSAGSLLFFARAWRTGARRDLAWWTILSALALLTQYFAGFLVGGTALLLAWRHRRRDTWVALAVLVVVEAALIPHLTGHVSHPAGWIDEFGLITRVQQVPVAFALNTLYKSAAVSYGLVGAALVAAALIGLLIAGSPARELRGAGIAAGLAACVLIVPLLLALAGHDYYEARAMIGGFVPLVVLVGAACTAPGARVAGAALAVALAAGFLFGQAKVQWGSAFYRRPEWRTAARALGLARTPRAVVAYDGQFAAPSLALYLPGVRWTGTAQAPQVGDGPATVSEIDVVGDEGQQRARRLPPGVRMISWHESGGYIAARFALPRPVRASRGAFAQLAGRLVVPYSGGASVLLQRPAT